MTANRMLCARGLAITSIFLVALCGILARLSQNPQTYFSESLGNARVSERVMIDDTQYVVEGGTIIADRRDSMIDDLRILRIAYAKMLAKHSPLIALAGTDPDDLEHAIEELRSARERLSDIQTSALHRTLVREDLYPVAFLESLARLERARLSFVESGNEADLARYQTFLREAADAYLGDIARFRLAFSVAVPRDVPEFAGTDVVVSRDAVLRQLSRLESGMRSTRLLVAKRERCVAGITSFCSNTEIAPIQVSRSTAPSDAPVSAIRDVRALFAATAHAPSIAEGPIYRLSDPACSIAPGVTPALVPFMYHSPVDRSPYERIFDVRDARFTPSEPYADLPFYAYFKDRDIAYVHNPSFTFYKCMRLGHDYGTAFAMQRVRGSAEKTPLSMHATASLADKVRVLENNLLSAAVEESDVREYVRIAQNISAENLLPHEESAAYAEVALMLNNRSAEFDKAVQLVARTEDINARLFERGVPVDLGAPYLFLIRSGVFLLFLGDNPSAVGAQSIAMRPSSTVPSTPFEFFSQTSDPARRAQMSHDLAFDLSLHASGGQPAAEH